MAEVLKDRRLTALSAAVSYLREAILSGTPPKTAYVGFLQRTIKYHLWTAEEIRQATDFVLPTYDPPFPQYTYYDLSYNTRTSEFSVAGGAPFYLSRLRTKFLAHLIAQPEVLHTKRKLYAATWGDDFYDEQLLRNIAKEVRDSTDDTIIPKDKSPETGQFSRRTFHRIQTIPSLGYKLKRVWDPDEIAQGKDRLWTPSGFNPTG